MIENRIVMPQSKGMVHTRLREAVIDAFGGCTVSSGVGSWRDPDGTILTEEVMIYDVAAERTDANYQMLRNIAYDAGKAADQKAVYLRANDRVEIVEIAPALGAAVETKSFERRLPKAGEVWLMRCGGKAAIVGTRAAAPETLYPLSCVVLDATGFSVELTPGHPFEVDISGRHLGVHKASEFDLTDYVSRF